MSHQLLRDDIEYIIHCDSEGNIIGPISKQHAHMPGVREALTHYSTWSMVYHKPSGKYGIQLKNPDKHDKQSAGKWDMGVAGHNCYVKNGSSYHPLSFSENLAKETEEEIGVKIIMFEHKKEFLSASGNKGFIFEEFHYKEAHNNEWVGLGLINVESTKVEFVDGEVVDFKWISPEEIKTYLVNADDYCAPLTIAFEKAEQFRKENSF